jgi:hypothetical protein
MDQQRDPAFGSGPAVRSTVPVSTKAGLSDTEPRTGARDALCDVL